MARKSSKRTKQVVPTMPGNYPQACGGAYPVANNPYGAPIPPAYANAFTYEPVPIKKRARGMILFVLLNIVTLGIYGLVVLSHVSQEINLIASDYDRKNTPYYCLAAFLSFITLGIYGVIYMNNLCARIGNELKRRNIKYKFSEASYWGWNVFGVLLVGIGPLVFWHKFFKAMKKLIADYNIYG